MAKKYLPLFLASSFFIAFLFSQLPLFAQVPADHLLISQIQITGEIADDEFVELYNPTLESINLANYRLNKEETLGATTSSPLVASLSGIITPHQFFLIGNPSYNGSPTKDLSYSSSSYYLTDNQSVVLLKKSVTPATVIDKVGMGIAQDKEGTAVPNPPANSSIRRIDYQDTDNNSVDFEIINPSVPRNSQSPADPPLTTPTPTPTPSPSPTVTPVPTVSPTPTPTLEPTSTPTPMPTPTPSPTPTIEPFLTPTPSPTPSSTPLPSPSASPPVFKGIFLTCSFSYHKIRLDPFFLRLPYLTCRRNPFF